VTSDTVNVDTQATAGLPLGGVVRAFPFLSIRVESFRETVMRDDDRRPIMDVSQSVLSRCS
jgi:hypothetical protein